MAEWPTQSKIRLGIASETSLSLLVGFFRMQFSTVSVPPAVIRMTICAGGWWVSQEWMDRFRPSQVDK